VNLLGDNNKKNTEIVIDASKEVGLEVNSERTRYILLYRQDAGQSRDVKRRKRPFENMPQIKYFGMRVRNKNFIQD
jgi:hypothetical protein